MRSRPPKLSPEKERAADAFIEGAKVDGHKPSPNKRSDMRAKLTAPAETKQKRVYPWQEPHIREDVNQAFSIRLPEPLYLKLKYISDQTGRSMNYMLKTLAEEMVEETLDDVL